MENPERRSRRYRSALRDSRAARTREAILDAARGLFEDGGFSATTIAAIAQNANVSAPTIYATFGSKSNVARALVQQMEESSDAALWRKRIAAEVEPHLILRAFAEWTAAFFSASSPSPTLTTQLPAEASDLVAQGNAQRRKALSQLIDRLDEHGALRNDLTQVAAVDRAWMLTGIEMYLNATHGCGWTRSGYVSWLSETLTQQVLTPSAQHPDLDSRGPHGTRRP